MHAPELGLPFSLFPETDFAVALNHRPTEQGKNVHALGLTTSAEGLAASDKATLLPHAQAPESVAPTS